MVPLLKCYSTTTIVKLSQRIRYTTADMRSERFLFGAMNPSPKPLSCG
jgi:hypothetical protein